MSEYNEHNSLYENSDYPSRRQAPSRPSRSGGSRQAGGSGQSSGSKRRRRRKGGPGRVAGMLFKVLGTLFLVGLCTGALVACFAEIGRAHV